MLGVVFIFMENCNRMKHRKMDFNFLQKRFCSDASWSYYQLPNINHCENIQSGDESWLKGICYIWKTEAEPEEEMK